MILGADNRKRWSKLDVLILNAYQRYLDETCGQHGGPVWMCRCEDPRLQVRTVEVACYAKQEVEKYQEAHKDDKHQVPVVPEFYATDGTPLIEFRDIYKQQMAAERAEAAAAD